MFRSLRPIAASFAALSFVALCGAGSLAAAASSPSDSATIASTVPPPDDPATPDALDVAGEKSASAPYRLEMFMSMSGLGLSLDGDTPLMTAEYADGQSHMRMDFAAMFAGMMPGGDMPAELLGLDLSMEFVTSGTDMYVRAPFFAALGPMMGGQAPELDVFVDLGDGWGYVDLTAVPGVDPTAISGSMGMGVIDPSAFLALLSEVEGAEQIGTQDIRGVSTTGVRADVSLADLMAAQGTTAASESANPFGDATFPIEVWVDKEGFVRRITFDLSGEALAEAAEAQGEDIPSTMLGGIEMSMTMEMFDYGADNIAIEVPTDFTDITDAFLELSRQG